MLWLTLACVPSQPVPVPSAAPVSFADAPRNVILFIGDGMGPGQVGLLELYARRAPERVVSAPTAFARAGERGFVGMSLHDPAEQLITDSACSATQLASGVRSLTEAVGVDETGAPVRTVLEKAEAAGWSTGIVSDTRLTHATPASFVAKVPSRKMEREVAAQMVASGADVLLSGGKRFFVPETGEGADTRDLLAASAAEGRVVVQTAAELAAAPDRVLGLFTDDGMPDAITEHRARDTAIPTLAEMSLAALTRLEKNEEGFFLVIEAGQIDWAAHSNDAGWVLHEMLRANAALDVVLDWVEEAGDTLLVVTGDHETGGLSLGYNRSDTKAPHAHAGTVFSDTPHTPHVGYADPAVLDLLYRQKRTLSQVLEDHADSDAVTLSEAVSEATGVPFSVAAAERVRETHSDPYGSGATPHVHDFEAFYPAGERALPPLIGRELATTNHVSWSTGGHTHIPVPVLAVGPGADTFSGILHHTEIGQKLLAAVP